MISCQQSLINDGCHGSLLKKSGTRFKETIWKVHNSKQSLPSHISVAFVIAIIISDFTPLTFFKSYVIGRQFLVLINANYLILFYFFVINNTSLHFSFKMEILLYIFSLYQHFWFNLERKNSFFFCFLLFSLMFSQIKPALT